VILVDSSVWIDHLRHSDPVLGDLLNRGQVLGHPVVVGEVALGSLRQRAAIVSALRALPLPVLAEHDEVLAMIKARTLHGRGIGFVDAHLLASVLLSPGSRLWTRDRRLSDVSRDWGLAFTD
jgi:predicted nucleic acid-binding protein